MSPSGHEMPLLLGRLMGLWEASAAQMHRIEDQLARGHDMFHRVDRRLTRLEEKASEKATVPRWERNLKRWAALLLPAATLYTTGSLEAALQQLVAVLK